MWIYGILSLSTVNFNDFLDFLLVEVELVLNENFGFDDRVE